MADGPKRTFQVSANKEQIKTNIEQNLIMSSQLSAKKRDQYWTTLRRREERDQ